MDEEKYVINFWFEWMATCFWGKNNKAKDKYGYYIAPEDLPISAELAARAKELADWHDDSLNWSYPPHPGPWRQEECDRFNEAVRQYFEEVKAELGDEFELRYEQDDVHEDPDLDEYLKDLKNFKRKS